MTSNLVAWADTRVDSPVWQAVRIEVAFLFLLPALAMDVVLFPQQVLFGFYPYGDLEEPDPAEKRHGTDRNATGPRGSGDPDYERWRAKQR
jgi:hypothetical protein